MDKVMIKEWFSMAAAVITGTTLGAAVSQCSPAYGWTTSSPNMETHYADYARGKRPRGRTVFVCHGSGCEWQRSVTFGANDIAAFRSAFKANADARDERRAIATAVADAERRVCRNAGTCRDRPGASFATSKIRGQMDCVDESINTTSYLLVFQTLGLLRHHTVQTPLHRYGFALYPHWGARIRDKQTGALWIVDSFFGPNGAPPKILPQKEWSRGQ